jgi:hypothetical protein
MALGGVAATSAATAAPDWLHSAELASIGQWEACIDFAPVRTGAMRRQDGRHRYAEAEGLPPPPFFFAASASSICDNWLLMSYSGAYSHSFSFSVAIRLSGTTSSCYAFSSLAAAR